jgi:hypothetical protein
MSRTARQIYYGRIKNSLIMTTYQRYIESVDDEEVQYVVDCDGTLHDLSGNIDSKLESVAKSVEYWKAKLIVTPNDAKAKRFYNKFKNLQEQILLLIEGKDIVAHA